VLLLISSAGFYGAERVTIELAEEMKRRGVDVTLGVFRNRRCPNLEIVEIAEERGIRHRLFECRGRVDPATAMSIRRALREDHIGILHSHEAKSNIYGLLSTAYTRTRTIATCHNWIGTGLTIRAYNLVDKLTLRFVTRVAAVSEAVRDEAIRFGVSPGNVVRVDNSIDHRQFVISDNVSRRIREELGIQPDAPVVGTISRLSDEKNIELILEAFARFSSEAPDARLLIVGEGRHRPALESRVRRLGMDDAVMFLGSRRDVPELLSIMNVFVLASRREGLPMVILEAMAAARPVIATPVGAIPTVLTHGESGVLIEGRDPEELTARIRHFVEDPAAGRAVGSKARQVVEDRFSIRRMGDDYLRMYTEALSA
jgi:glycosyltransferase involved in cell wall biosynthesis